MRPALRCLTAVLVVLSLQVGSGEAAEACKETGGGARGR